MRIRENIVGPWGVTYGVVALAVAFVAWYIVFARYNRRRGTAVLHWVQAACLGKGRILNPHWQSSSSLLKATLHISSRWFEDARLTIRLFPRPQPWGWFISRWREQEETLTFEADMGLPPSFHLDVIRHRWSGRTGAASKSRTWNISRPGPVVLTTKEDWPTELTPVVNALTSWRDKDFVSVRFNQNSPHFTAIVTLQNLTDQTTAAALLGLFRELAASSSARQH
jgi:hypothetical protein